MQVFGAGSSAWYTDEMSGRRTFGSHRRSAWDDRKAAGSNPARSTSFWVHNAFSTNRTSHTRAPSVCYLEGKCRVASCSHIHCILSASVELAECALCSLIDAVVPAACPDGHCRVSERVGDDRRAAPGCPVVLIAATVIHSITDQIPSQSASVSHRKRHVCR